MNVDYVLAAIFVVVLFELAAWLGAADSRDGFDSPEWERRQAWRTNGE